ncbi:MAG: rubredoxin [Synergistetes bacterium]|nr:rubredoxin [Synergistota bacterium]
MNSKAFYKLSYGLYVVCSVKEGKLNGQIANTVFQVANNPLLLAVSLNKKNLTHEYIKLTGVFSVSVLSKDTPLRFIGHFGFRLGRDFDKFSEGGYKYTIGKTGAPVILDNSLAFFEAELIKNMDLGSHTLFIGRVLETDFIREGEPMTYAYYHEIKRGEIPEVAPSYVKEEVRRLAKYRCIICNYVYDPEKGDPDAGIKPGTPFEKLPDDWFCPVCGAGKDQFEKEE